MDWSRKVAKLKKIFSASRWIFRSPLTPLLLISFCIAPGLLLSSCSSLPKETYLTSTCLTGLKKVVIVTSVNAPNVSYATMYTGMTVFELSGLLGFGLESAIRSGIDQAHTAKINEHMDTSSIEDRAAQSFIQTVKKGDLFQVIDYVKDKNQDKNKFSTTGYDAVIRLSVVEILLRRTAAEYISLTARVRGQLENLGSGETVWDREEFVTNPEPHTLDYYKENGLMELDTMLEKAGKNLAYDFLYSK
jgi:hypothetical protein